MPRCFLARRRADGHWLRRVDTPPDHVTEAAFLTSAADEFRLAEADCEVVVVEFETREDREQAAADMQAGRYAGFPVVTPPKTAPGESADGLRENLCSVFSGTDLQRRQRWLDAREKYPPLGDLLVLLRGRLSVDDKGHVTELLTRIRAKVGTGATEVLTATEYENLKALADQKGLGALFPAYP